MACGTPVLTSTTAAMPEVAGPAALRVDPHDRDALAEGIRTLDEQPSLRRTLTARGRDRARSFSWSRTAEALLPLYEEVARSAPKPATAV
jgi:glycosyltransferase involved in cell wall biosynthesis